MSESIVVGGRTFHLLFPDLFRALTAEEMHQLRASIVEHGVLVAIVTDESNGVIDGGHRLLAAHDLGLTEVPTDVVAGRSLEQKRALAETLNDARRHLSPEERAERAVKLRQEGLSYRQIGERLGVSPMTAQRDVQTATVSSDTVPLPDRIIGRDGKERPATRQPAPERTMPLPPASPSRPEPVMFPEETEPDAIVEEPEEAEPEESPEPEPAVPPPKPAPQYPHSDKIRLWMSFVAGKMHSIDVEDGGIEALLAEPGKWDWKLTKEFIIPQMADLLEALSRYKKEVENAAHKN